MKSKFTKEADRIVVSLTGKITYEGQEPWKDELNRLLHETMTDSVPKRIIFDFEKLEFVGSSGISSFIQILKEFNTHSKTRPIYCNVRSEFQKLIRAFDEEELFDFDAPRTLHGRKPMDH